jgi:hypothetical protein
MNCFSWNCRGGGGPEKIQFLKDLLHSTRVEIAFISKTRSSVRRAVEQLRKISGYNWHMVPAQGLSGGLWLLWANNLKVRVMEADKHFIFAHITDDTTEGWILRAIYGDASHQENARIWGKIEQYATHGQSPLCCIGDFNAIPTL